MCLDDLYPALAKNPPLQAPYTVKYRLSWTGVLEANHFMLILELLHVSELENTEEYAEFLLFKRKNYSFKDTQSVITKSQAFSVAGLVKDKGLHQQDSKMVRFRSQLG